MPSKVEELVHEKHEANPEMSMEQLAAFANNVAARRGFSFYFAPTGFKEHSGVATYILRTVHGEKIAITAPLPDDHPCGIYTEFPVLRANPMSFTLLLNSGSFDFEWPRRFGIDRVELVDAALRKTLRSWVVPMDQTPVAISPDGNRVYVDSSVDNLYIEVDPQGNYRYVAKHSRPMLTAGVDLKRFPRDRNNAYLGFRRFRSPKKLYTLKFSHPCT